jgi:hypothetical protein
MRPRGKISTDDFVAIAIAMLPKGRLKVVAHLTDENRKGRFH